MKKNIFLIAAFTLILFLPMLDLFFDIQPVKNLFEKRVLVEVPVLPKTLKEAEKYPEDFENYFNDNYGFRKTLVSTNAEMMDKVFNESPDARVVLGKDGWLYFDNYDSLLDATKRAKISDDLIEKGVEGFADNWKKLKAKNIDYLLVIAADKSLIYSEFLPKYIKNNISDDGEYRIDRFINALKAKYPDFPILDLRATLLDAKKNEIIYHKTDTHWNRRGSHYAYLKIMKKLNIKPRLRSEFANKEDEYIKGDISDIVNSDAKNLNYDLRAKFTPKARMLLTIPESAKKLGADKFYRPHFYVNRDSSLPGLFVYHDSFFGDLFSFTSEHFANSFYVNEFPCNLDLKIFKAYGSKVVIQQFWEGRIEQVLRKCK